MIFINDVPVIVLDPIDDPSITKVIEESDSVTKEDSAGSQVPLC